MKTSLLFTIFWFITGYLVNAQRKITIEEKNIGFKHGTISGFMVIIPEVPLKTIEESWIKALEKATKSKVQKEMGELSIFGAIIKEVAGGPMNVYSYIKQQDSAILLAATFELKKDEYITSEKRDYEFAKAKEYLFQFAKEHYLELAKNELQTEEKKLNKMENNLSSLQNDKIKLEKMIITNNASIVSTNDEIAVIRTKFQSLNSELSAQTSQLETMEDGAGKEEKRKYISDLNKQIKKINGDISSGEKKVTALSAEIENAQRDGIPKNIIEQDKIRKAIIPQKEIVRILTSKYTTIKAY